ncbi:MAG TPA: cyclic nucleotide-binding domain-containing protein [Gemmatimonadota bacterium]|nr:cyclic nucleotide-binding domain-containing protein [Gemmatimonadota bacterium]
MAPLPRRSQIVGTQAAIAGSLVLFWIFLQSPTAWTAGAFYVWINVFSLLLVSQFFLLGSDLFDPRQAKRIFGFIGAGGLAGGVAGSAAAGFLAEPVGSANLLLIGAGLVAGSGAFAVRVFKIGRFPEERGKARAGGGRTPRRAPRESVGEGLRIVRRVRHLKRIALLLFATTIVSTFVDWLFNAAVESAIPNQVEQTEFFGHVFAVFNGIALIVQILLTSLSLRTLGLAGSLAMLPLAMGAGVAGFLILPGLLTISFAKGADSALSVSINQAAREILYLPVPAVLTQRAKPFIDIVVARGADGLAGALILLGSGVVAWSGRGLTLLTLGLILLWGLAVWGVRQSYRRSLERLLAVRDVDLEEAVETSLDSTTVRDILAQLDPGTEADSVHYALDLLSGLPPAALRSELLRLLGHPDASVRARAIGRLSLAAGAEDVARVRPLADDPSAPVRAEAALLLCRHEPDRQLERIERWLEGVDGADGGGPKGAAERAPEIEAALSCMITEGGEAGAERAGQAFSRLVRMAGDEGAPVRAACARALGRLTEPHPLHRHLETLLSDGHPEVVQAAIESTGRVFRRDLLPTLLPLLGALATRGPAIRALAAYGEAGIPYLAASLRDSDLSPEARRWLPSVLVRIATPAAFLALAEALPALRDSTHRLYALKALNKMRRRHPNWEIPAELVRQELDSELRAAYDIERQRLALSRSTREMRGDGAADVDRLAEALGTYSWALGFQAERTIERAFRLQALLYSPRTIYFAYAGLAGRGSAYGAHALELLETALSREDARRILPLIDPDVSSEERPQVGRQFFTVEERSVVQDIERILERGEPWLQAYAAPLAATIFAEALGPELERLSASGSPVVQPIARRARETGQGDEREEEGSMGLSSVEKAAALRRTELLSQLGADDLLQLAAVAEERSFEGGEHLYYEGEEGDYLYVVLEGEIRNEKGGQEIVRSQPGEAVGTFSILDYQPRSASAVATKPTRTLAIHRADLSQILADNYSLVEGLFKHLTGIIRGMNERVFTAEDAPSEDRAKGG